MRVVECLNSKLTAFIAIAMVLKDFQPYKYSISVLLMKMRAFWSIVLCSLCSYLHTLWSENLKSHRVLLMTKCMCGILNIALVTVLKGS
jgi:hypothetical protein